MRRLYYLTTYYDDFVCMYVYMVAHRIWNTFIFTSNLERPLTMVLFDWIKISYDINLHIMNDVGARLSFNLAPLLLKTCKLIPWLI